MIKQLRILPSSLRFFFLNSNHIWISKEKQLKWQNGDWREPQNIISCNYESECDHKFYHNDNVSVPVWGIYFTNMSETSNVLHLSHRYNQWPVYQKVTFTAIDLGWQPLFTLLITAPHRGVCVFSPLHWLYTFPSVPECGMASDVYWLRVTV